MDHRNTTATVLLEVVKFIAGFVMAAVFFMTPAGIFFVIKWALPQVDLLAKWSQLALSEKSLFNLFGLFMGAAIVIYLRKRKKTMAMGFLFYMVLDLLSALIREKYPWPN
jgi:hypothetical protein